MINNVESIMTLGLGFKCLKNYQRMIYKIAKE